MKNYIYLILYSCLFGLSTIFIQQAYQSKHMFGLLAMLFFIVFSMYNIYKYIGIIINNFKPLKIINNEKNFNSKIK
jgi:hypothetical protein